MLTALLMPALMAAGEARVVALSSVGLGVWGPGFKGYDLCVKGAGFRV